jgi:hypothetical protein
MDEEVVIGSKKVNDKKKKVVKSKIKPKNKNGKIMISEIEEFQSGNSEFSKLYEDLNKLINTLL